MALTTFTESNLTFSFDDENWNILKYDQEPVYLEISHALEGTKAIDFLGFYNSTALILFEVKGFRGYGSQKSVCDRLADGMEILSIEVAQKVKDTVAAIAGISRNIKTRDTIWAKAANQIIQNRELVIVAWVEEDLTNKSQRDRKKNEMSVRTLKLKNKLSWLTTNITIDNVKEQHFSFEGFTVTPAN
jgi:hypothetical protein